MRLNELINLKTETKNKINAIQQKFSHFGELKDEIKHKFKQLKKKITKLPKKTRLILQIL